MNLSPLPIRSAQGDYEVAFVPGIDAVVEAVLAVPGGVIVVDRRVAQLYAKQLAPLFEHRPVLMLDATEEEKTLAGVEKTVRWLQANNCTKQSRIVAIGGGIIQDICAFSAHIYYRGLSWVFVPTTLLSMSDSCIGAKCTINLGEFKNQLGLFRSPSRVIVCPRFVDTLSDRDVASGYGEILKLMLTGSPAHVDRLELVVATQGLRNGELAALIRESLEVKKRIIEEDEYEADLRRILNYGHSFGHALESVTHHDVPHGLAVAWGMDLINFISWRRGLLDEVGYLRVHNFIKGHLPYRLKSRLTASQLIQSAKRDKKVADGRINLVLYGGPGRLSIVKTSFDEALEALLTEYIETRQVFPVA